MLADFRFAVRQLLKTPGFTAVAVLALALGIGANTAIFSVVHGVLLRPLPYPEQDRLLFIGEWSEQVPTMSVAYPNFQDWRARQQAFSSIGAFRFQGFNYVGEVESERVTGSMASHDLFAALAVPPLRGRLYGAEDDKPGVERTVVLSEKLWHRSFGGRDDVLGQKIQLSGNFYTVIGIMPAAFQFPSSQVELWVPLGLWADQYTARGSHPGIYCVARPKPGVSYEAGVADIKGIAEQLAREHPDTNARQSAAVQPLTDRAFGQVRPTLFVLLGAAGFVLLIACANVANLQLARAHARAREFAVRAALGAGRARIIRQLLIESVLLGGLGCAAGLIVGVWGLDALRSMLPSGIPRIADVTLNGPVLLFAIGASLLTSIVFGLLPALHAAKQDLRETLAQGARGGSASGNSWRAALIVGEFALTCVLLVGAGLMIRTLANLYRADPGYSTEQTLTAGWVLPGEAYRESAKRTAVIQRAHERLAAVPGVKSAAVVNPLPLSQSGNQNSYYVEGTPLPEPGRQPSVEFFQASGNLFSTLRIPLLAGRTFDERDTATAPRVAIVDTRFVEKNFPPGTDPLGKRFVYGSRPPEKDSDWFQIVGVVAHIQNYGLASTQITREQSYVPHTQSVPAVLTFALRTDQSASALAPSIRAAMREVAPELPIFSVQTMDELFTNSISTQRLSVYLLGTFAALALVLAALGLYGVLAYNVGQRTREIGVRMALGATQGSVVALILRHGLKLAALGLMLGLIAAAGLTRLLRTVLFEVSAFDPVSFAGVAVGLAGIGVLACWLPARRATKVDPMSALRAE
jgi:putative ABC transport system permease protein